MHAAESVHEGTVSPAFVCFGKRRYLGMASWATFACFNVNPSGVFRTQISLFPDLCWSLACMQARIQSLQATLVSDSSQHAAAYSQLQQQHEHLHREHEAASHKGDPSNAYYFADDLPSISSRGYFRLAALIPKLLRLGPYSM